MNDSQSAFRQSLGHHDETCGKMATDFTLLLKMKIILLKILTVVVFLICTKMLQNYLNKIKLAK